MAWHLMGPFLLAALVVQALPGPGMLFIVTHGAVAGRRAGVQAAFGAATGMVVHTLAATAGLATLFEEVPAAYRSVRIAGGCYLLWLAIGHLKSKQGLDWARASSVPRRVFIRAMANNLANPKIVLFYIAFLPQFVDRSSGAVSMQFLSLGLLFTSIGLLIDVVLGSLAGRIGDAFRRQPRAQRALDRAAGVVLGALGIRVLAQSRP